MPQVHSPIIQGGMGVGVSGWRLARAVSVLGQLGVVSGTALAVILARRLQLGDPDGQMRHALQHFPYAAVAQRVLDAYYIPGGKPEDQPFKLLPFPTIPLSTTLTELTVLANFAEIFLAKEGHGGRVGINYLEKVQLPNLASIYGAMIAGVDYVLMGAGVPRFIPGILDQFSRGEPAQIRIDVLGVPPERHTTFELDPQKLFGAAPKLRRPIFLAIVSSATLAITLARKSTGQVDGFVVEGASAGGHNAPPRGAQTLNARGEPIYSDRDQPDIERIRSVGLPFWMAGSYGDPVQLQNALRLGATGIQVGTAFAFCEESGLDARTKRRVLEEVMAGRVDVLTDPLASPTGFPFKVLQLEGTLSDRATYERRERRCDLGYLRSAYEKPGGTIGYRCPAEPVGDYVAKGGEVADTVGRKCVCNGLLAGIGLGQVGSRLDAEKPLLTSGEDVRGLQRLLAPPNLSYTAADVIRFLLGEPAQAP